MARENCVELERAPILPPLSGAPGDWARLFQPEKLPKRIREHIILLKDAVAEAAFSPQPPLVFLVGEWGNGRTTVYDALIAPLSETYGLQTLYTTPSTAGGLEGLRRLIEAYSGEKRLVFIDEAEDIVYDSLHREFAETLLRLFGENKPPAIFIGITPLAYQRLFSSMPPGLAERLKRRSRVVEIPVLSIEECLEIANTLASLSVKGGLDTIVADPRLVTPLLMLNGCTLGGIASALRMLLARSISIASGRCGETRRGVYRLGWSEIAELVISRLENSALKCFDETISVLLEACTSKSLNHQGCRELVHRLVLQGAIPLEEATRLAGAEAVKALTGLKPNLQHRIANKCNLSVDRIVEVRTTHSSATVTGIREKKSSPSRGPLLVLNRQLFSALYTGGRERLLEFIADRRERAALARISTRERDLLVGYSVLLGLAIGSKSMRIEAIRNYGEYVVLTIRRNGRIAILVKGVDKSLDQGIIVTGVKPAIIVSLATGNKNCKSLEYEPQLHATKICHSLQVEDTIRLSILGRKLGEAISSLPLVSSPETVARWLAEKGIIAPVLREYADNLLLREEPHVLRLIERLVEEGFQGIPLYLAEEPPSDIYGYVRAFTLFLGSGQSEAKDYLETLTLIVPPRPRSGGIIPYSLWSRLAKEKKTVIPFAAYGGLTAGEKLVLKAIEFFGGEASLDDISLYTGSDPVTVGKWVKLLAERGLVEEKNRKIILITREAINQRLVTLRRSLEALRREIEALPQQWRLYAVPSPKGKAFVSSLDLLLALAETALREALVREAETVTAARLLRGASILLKQLRSTYNALQEARRLYNSILSILRHVREVLEGINVAGIIRVGVSSTLLEKIEKIMTRTGLLEVMRGEEVVYLNSSFNSPMLAILAYELIASGAAEPEWSPAKGVPRRLRLLANIADITKKAVAEAEARIKNLLERIESIEKDYSLKVSRPQVGEIVITMRDPADAEQLPLLLRDALQRPLALLEAYAEKVEALARLVVEAKSLCGEAERKAEEMASILRAATGLAGMASTVHLPESVFEAREEATRLCSIIKELGETHVSPDNVDSWATRLRDQITIVKDLLDKLRGVEEELKKRLASKTARLANLLDAVARLAGISFFDEYVKKTSGASWSLEHVLQVYEKLVKTWSHVVDELVKKTSLSPIEAKAFMIIIDAKMKYDEIPLSKAVPLIAENLGVDDITAKKVMLSLIEKGLLDPRI